MKCCMKFAPFIPLFAILIIYKYTHTHTRIYCMMSCQTLTLNNHKFIYKAITFSLKRLCMCVHIYLSVYIYMCVCEKLGVFALDCRWNVCLNTLLGIDFSYTSLCPIKSLWIHICDMHAKYEHFLRKPSNVWLQSPLINVTALLMHCIAVQRLYFIVSTETIKYKCWLGPAASRTCFHAG